MAGLENEEVVGFEQGLSWLPSHVLEEALCDTTEKLVKPKQHHRRHRPKPPSEDPLLHQKSSSRTHHRPTYQGNRASAGAGMQAFFLVSGKKSTGTGVFIPYTGSQPNKKKPACSPVLLPNRVVHALNLNVQSLGLQVSPRQGQEETSKKKNKTEASTTRKCCTVSTNNSTELFLPKEWTY